MFLALIIVYFIYNAYKALTRKIKIVIRLSFDHINICYRYIMDSEDNNLHLDDYLIYLLTVSYVCGDKLVKRISNSILNFLNFN